MDRDRDDKRGLYAQARSLQETDRSDPPTGKFDPAKFDMPPDPPPSTAGHARDVADAAQAHSFFSHLATDIQRILVGFGTLRDLVSDVRASLADTAARDTQRADEEKARDKAIAARLVDPAVLAARAEAGARHGAADGLAGAAETLRRRIDVDTDAHTALADRLAADVADHRAYEMRRRRRDGWWNGALAAFALLVPLSLGYGYHLGNGAGEASGYAHARDEIAAASWANTPNGTLARQIDQVSTSTIPLIANCSGEGWKKTKQDGRRVCYAAPTTGWYRP